MFLGFRNRLVSQPEQVIAFALLFNSFSWFFIGQIMVDKVAFSFKAGLESLSLGLAYPASLIVSGIVGAACLLKLRKISFFRIWLLFGIIASLLFAIPTGFSLPTALAIIIFAGSSLGIGMPLCLAYFANSVTIEKRGKTGGITFLATTSIAPLVVLALSALDVMSSAVVFAAWRGWSLVLLLFISQESTYETPCKQRASYNLVLHDKSFVLYFIAWFMFSLVDGFESVIMEPHMENLHSIMIMIEPFIAGLSALVTGLLSDWIGRKRVMIFGFISLGIAYAILGIASQIWFSWLFHFVVNGIAIGLLWLLFTIVLWGDLSRFNSEKYYAIGETPLFLTQIISLLLAPYVVLIPEISAFSLAAFFLFIAVIPLLYAPETLPEKKIQERQLKIYTEEAIKMKQKIEQK